MPQLKPTRTVYTVSEFVDWQRSGTLQLKPIFQRREIWSHKAKSLLIDTVVNGLPVPIIFLRRTQNLKTLSTTLEVVDGQQRLRTLFSFIDRTLLKDFDKARDQFTVLPIHNEKIAKKEFSKLAPDVRRGILSYEISTHVFPPDTEDAAVLRIFARLNSTGAKLNHQELRNAKFFGDFKTVAYDLAFQGLPLWRKWNLFDDDELARMGEVESVSDYLYAIIFGLQGKSQPRLNNIYEKFDDNFRGSKNVATRFRTILEQLDDRVGDLIAKTPFSRQALFYSLFTACYDHIYGLDSNYKLRKKPKSLPAGFRKDFETCARRIASGKLPEKVADAMDRATADKGRRATRHEFFVKELGLVSA